ncbi:MAG: type II toxin-antitoxin system RelE/ParE family toxin [Bryobacterales bacterium]|nr:type II toxin-antitoxin system RelE/ParE family toxin [Bryobacterales bacterium]
MRLRWTTPAIDDLTQICDFTRERFGEAQARRAAIGLYEAADSLKAMPQRGRKGRKAGTREIIASNLPFIIVYRVGQDAVEILRILHGARQWP